MSTAFDFAGARKAGYSDEEISSFLQTKPKAPEKNPNFDYQGAINAGYSPQEVDSFLSQSQPPQQPDNRDLLTKGVEKGGRLATQAGIGAIQRVTAPYDIPMILAKKYGVATAPLEFRQNAFAEIERLQEEKARGEWSPESQKEYDHYVDLIKNPENVEQFLPKEEDLPNLDVGSLLEKGAEQFGVDLSPQGADEMALRWIGFIKNPTKAQDLLKNGFNPQNLKELGKALLPTGKEAGRGVGAALALQYAAENELGPVGTMMAAILGDMAPSLALSVGKGALQFGKAPIQSTKAAGQAIGKGGKQLAAKSIAAFTSKDKIGMQKALIQDFREAGVLADAGTISGNNLVKWIQGTLQQSGLTGAPLEELKNSLSKNVVQEYKRLSSQLGQSVFESRYEAGEALKIGLNEAREVDLSGARELYKSARARAGESQVFAGNVGSLVQEIEKALEPGSFKSAEQRAVLDILNKIKNDVLAVDGTPKGAGVDALINNKIALNDAIDYEMQGGTKQLLKRVVGELDKSILSHGEVDPLFAKEWAQANAKFAKHAQLFRGKTLSAALKAQDPSLIFSKMNTPHGIEQIKKALSVTPAGKVLFKQLSAYKLEELIGKNLVNSTTNQVNFGTFSKLLEKGQNRQIVKSLLGEKGLRDLERLQRGAGKLAETAQKFLNTSRSGVHAADLGAAGKIVMDIGNALAGNPWPLVRSGGILLATRNVAKLLADAEFRQLLEDAILAKSRLSAQDLQTLATKIAEKSKRLIEPAKAALVNQPAA